MTATESLGEGQSRLLRQGPHGTYSIYPGRCYSYATILRIQIEPLTPLS